MKHLFNDLNQTEKNRILEMHKALDNKNVIQEQEQYTPGMGGAFDNRRQGQQASSNVNNIINGVNMDSSLFLNGVDKIDKNSDVYQSGLQNLKELTKAINEKGLKDVAVTIQGGASAVGSAQGYDNQALAKRRANNFIAAIKQDLGTNLPFSFNVSTAVGTATVKNSPAANAEQFVKISYPRQSRIIMQSPIEGRSSTALSRTPVAPPKKGVTPTPTDGSRPYVNLKIYYNNGQRQALLKHINSAGDTIRPVLIDIDTGDWAK